MSIGFSSCFTENDVQLLGFFQNKDIKPQAYKLKKYTNTCSMTEAIAISCFLKIQLEFVGVVS